MPAATAMTKSKAVTLAAMLAILAGLFGVAAGLLRLGFITDLLAKSIRYGYLNGIALTVIVSQLPKLFGFSVKADGLFERAAGFVSGVLAGKVNWVTLLLGGSTLVVILLLKRFKRIPGVLVAVGGSTLAVALLGLEKSAGVAVLGDLPQGLPTFSIPIINLEQIAALVTAAYAFCIYWSFQESEPLLLLSLSALGLAFLILVRTVRLDDQTSVKRFYKLFWVFFFATYLSFLWVLV